MSRSITIYHSPDADDAFMFYGLACGAIRHPEIDFRHELSDIESLNHRAMKGELEVTAISVHTLGYLNDRYAVLQSGASMGGIDYGPRIVTKNQVDFASSKTLAIGVPGTLTSAVLALRMYMKEKGMSAKIIPMHFEEIIGAVKAGEVQAGLIIHEGQITHQKDGLSCVLDLGQWWWQETKLPLPLGINVVRKDLGQETCEAVSHILRDSIEYALSHRSEALDYALTYGRGLNKSEADTFVGMYVNEWTRNLGNDGKRSLELFLGRARKENLLTVHAVPAETRIQYI